MYGIGDGGNHQDGSSSGSGGRARSRSPLSFDSDHSCSSGRTTPLLREIVIIGESGRSTGTSGGDSRPNSRPNSRNNSRRPSLVSSCDGSDSEYYSARDRERMRRTASRSSDLGTIPRSALKVTIAHNPSPIECNGSHGGATSIKQSAGGKEQDRQEKTTRKKKMPTMADELPTPVTRMLLTVLFERFDRNGDSCIDCDEFQRLISSCNMRRGKRRRPRRNDVLPLLRALDQDGDGYMQLDEFEGWVTKGFHMSLHQLTSFAEKGNTEAMLVDFLLALRADVKGILGRIKALVERYSTDGSDRKLDFAGFANMCWARARSREDAVSTSEIATFLKSMGCEDYIRSEDLRTLLCRSVINRGLSIVGRGQQRHRRIWVLIRKCGFYITDGEIDQLDMDEEIDGYYDGEGEEAGDDYYSNEDELEEEEEEYDDDANYDDDYDKGGDKRSGRSSSRRHHRVPQGRQRRSSRSQLSTKSKPRTSKVRPQGQSLSMGDDLPSAGEETFLTTAVRKESPDLVRETSSMSTSTSSFLSDNGMLPHLVRMCPPKIDTSELLSSASISRDKHNQLPVTPLVAKSQQRHQTLPPPLRQPSLTRQRSPLTNRIDVTPLQERRKMHTGSTADRTPLPPSPNAGSKSRK